MPKVALAMIAETLSREKSCSPIPDPPKRFSCNTTTFTCAEDPLGDEKATCDTSCSNSTPAELVGIWRGLYVQQNFTKGEWELNFSTTTAAWGPHGTPTNTSETQRLALQFHFGPRGAQRTGDEARLKIFGGEGLGVHC